MNNLKPKYDIYTYKDLKRAYQKGYRSGVKRGKTIAINCCMALGRLTAQPKGYYEALGEVVDNLEGQTKLQDQEAYQK